MRERFNTVAVAIPAQQFHVRCHVSVERQVPVMTDFAIRLLHLAGTVETSALRDYFGLNNKELIDLLDLLRGEGLVEESGGRLSLTSYAEARFVGSSDGLPRFTRIAERQSKPIFELLSYTPLSKAIAGTYWDNSIELDWAAIAPPLGQTVEHAEAAFHRHFLDIDRLEQDDDGRRAYSCYKVDSIMAGRPFNVPLPVNFEVDDSGNVEFDVDDQLDLLPDSLRSTLRQLTADKIGKLTSHTDRFNGFADYFADSLLPRFLTPESSSNATRVTVVRSGNKLVLPKKGTFDFSSYVRDVHAVADGELYDDGQSRAILGALYMPKNQERFLQTLAGSARRLSAEGSNRLRHPSEMVWVIPDTELWGRTQLVRDFIERLRETMKREFDERIQFIAVAPAAQSEQVERLRRRGLLLMDAGFNRVYFGPPVPNCERFEALLLPGVYGAAMYQWKVPSMDVLSVPLGFGTRAPSRLRRMANFVRDAGASARHRVQRGSGDGAGDRKLKISETSAADFLYLEKFFASANPAEGEESTN